jgi:hypothetical protein
MRRHFCPKCHHRIFFEQIRCENCWQPLAFDPVTLTIRQLEDVTACSNRILIGCNWAAEERNQYCCSCALNRTIPNLGSSKNRPLWSRVEGAKRRLTYDLCRLKLPLTSEDSTRQSQNRSKLSASKYGRNVSGLVASFRQSAFSHPLFPERGPESARLPKR